MMTTRINAWLKPFIWPVITGILLAIIFLQYQRSLLQATVANANNEQPVISYANAVAVAMPSVVNIYTARIIPSTQHPLLNDPLFKRFLENRGFRQQDKIVRGLGSGVIVSEDGFILTNNHVISKADHIRVMLADGRERDAKLIGVDAATDLAVLKIDMQRLKAAEFADPDSVQIGDIVLAIGNPYGIGQTVTQGIVSAIGRYGLNLNTYESYIQTDAAINRGNSGGALVNTDGGLIGINSGLYSQSGGSNGIGFAIPNDISQYVLQNIIQHGEVERGWLGVSGEEITPTIADTFSLPTQRGVIVTSIVENGPAYRAGLLPGDIITHIDGEKIGNGNDGTHQIAQKKPGSSINVSIYRQGAIQNVLVTIGKKPAENRSDHNRDRR